MAISLEECKQQHPGYIRSMEIAGESGEWCGYCATLHELELNRRAMALRVKLFHKPIDTDNIMMDNSDMEIMKCTNPKCEYSKTGWIQRVVRPKKCPGCGKKIEYKKES